MPSAAGPPPAVDVEVRYWASIRAAAGVSSDRVPAGTLASVLAAARALHEATPRFAEVLSVCSVLVDEQPVRARENTDLTVRAGATVDLLPPFAGGCRAVGGDREHPDPETGSHLMTR